MKLLVPALAFALTAPFILAPLAPAQEETTAPPATQPPSGSDTADAAARPDAASAEELRQRIHDMRMNLLLGGSRVRQAEREAIDFYGGKSEAIERRLDSAQAELTAKRASYDLVLRRSLEAPGRGARAEALEEAAALGAEVRELEAEVAALEERRGALGELVTAVEGRERDRERLVARLETSTGLEPGWGFPMGGVGLAPAVAAPATSPLENDALIQDLLARDPVGARRVLWERDPEGYWQRFPLRPPAQALADALAFPLPDLPGNR